MARRKRGSPERRRPGEPAVSPETRRDIGIVTLFALGGIALLAVAGLAGSLGRVLDTGLAAFFGLDRVVLPLMLLLFGVAAVRPEKQLGSAGVLGVILLVGSGNGIIHLAQTGAGGWLGAVFAAPLTRATSELAATVILLALAVVSLLLALNTSLERLAAVRRILLWPFAVQKLFRRASSSNIENETGRSEHETPDSARWNVKSVEVAAPTAAATAGGDNAAPSAQLSLTVAGRRTHRKIELPLDLLNNRTTKPSAGDIDAARERIRKTFEHFGIIVDMGDISVGPTVTQYTLKPAEGIKLTRITGLANDLALALAAHPIRIEAPIPGKSLVGVEVPNQTVATVPLRTILEAREFRERKSSLTIALGKDVSGAPHVADLARMPHLLIAGATGSGKTVSLNSIIISLLYQNGPDDLKLLMVDPKRVELLSYNGIPHLIAPVITDIPKTVNALKWCIGEMERRFDVLSKSGHRDIGAYNRSKAEPLPYLVVLVDELADLMISAAPEVEPAIIRLAQMSRATGIHLVLATQRPSVDVITGLIKANITSRIAFAVASSTDSRTILDTAGAEKLLGRGDLLYTSAELSKPKRLQGALVSDDDIKRVVDYIKTATDAPPEYLTGVTERLAPDTAGSPTVWNTADASADELLGEAKETVLRAGKASASLLQRRLKVGYARAARLLDLLEEQGIIGPGDGAKPRAILIPRPAEYGDPAPDEENGEETPPL